MIKVNLLRGYQPSGGTTTPVPIRSRMGLVLMAVFVLILSGLGTSWYYLQIQVGRLKERRDTLRTEHERLQQARKQIDELEKLRHVRESRIKVIEKLKESQPGPVVLLNHVIRSLPLPAALWLTVLDQKADRVQIKGYAVQRESIPDFMSNLSRSGYFSTVDLELIEVAGNTIRFSLICGTTRTIPTE